MKNQKCKCGWLKPTEIVFQPHTMNVESIGFRCPVCGDWSVCGAIETDFITTAEMRNIPQSGN